MKTIIFMALFLSGCSNIQPYYEVGVSYDVNRMDMSAHDDWDTSEKSKYGFSGEIGGTLSNSGISFGVRHNSYIFVDAPFNNEDEWFSDQVFIKYRKEFDFSLFRK